VSSCAIWVWLQLIGWIYLVWSIVWSTFVLSHVYTYVCFWLFSLLTQCQPLYSACLPNHIALNSCVCVFYNASTSLSSWCFSMCFGCCLLEHITVLSICILLQEEFWNVARSFLFLSFIISLLLVLYPQWIVYCCCFGFGWFPLNLSSNNLVCIVAIFVLWNIVVIVIDWLIDEPLCWAIYMPLLPTLACVQRHCHSFAVLLKRTLCIVITHLLSWFPLKNKVAFFSFIFPLSTAFR
jgi:hypothetical protein